MYEKPKVQRLGSVRELTEDVLKPGGGDCMVGCAAVETGCNRS
jgi:hypothetical protein